MRISLVAEFLGSAFLLMIVVGSGIMAENLSQGNVALALLINSLVTGAGLYVLIQCLGDLSGAHLNPVVSLVEFLQKNMDRNKLALYLLAQFSGSILGIFITHAMFNLTLLQISTKDRTSHFLWISEIVATFGLIMVIGLLKKKKAETIPLAVGLYITAAYWFTSSSSFANPAVTVARLFTDTFCGISPVGVLPFVLAQVIGAIFAFILLK